jgi:hypothetical protein
MSKSATASRRESMGVILHESGANPVQISRLGKSQARDSSRKCDMQRTDVARGDRATRDVNFGLLCTCTNH